MDDLVMWLRAQLDDDERVAQEAVDASEPRWTDGGQWGESVNGADAGSAVAVGAWTGYLTDGIRQHIARHDPARVLREVAAKRTIIDMWLLDNEYSTGEDSLRHLAAVYSDRPGYRPEWAPGPSYGQ